ncbi:hypothetical protein B7P43_G11351 [Cryptotermes secundus]|uniref:Tc1-like transposase DDE domain-containing protein n=1 Tax=Cryptotermes secundus TaxID=105785 RepID=A0A2J7QDE3_9NEOP|nr:hypothetical protein B7P43_G11351 [Cryptotermes secundus]
MKFQYCDACLSHQQVYKWSRKFANGVTSVEDAPRLGQAYQVVTPENTAAVEATVRENRRVTLNKIAASLNIREMSLLQHDNAWPHTAHATVATIQDLHFECLPHPPYTPDLAPSDYHIWAWLKDRDQWRALVNTVTNLHVP